MTEDNETLVDYAEVLDGAFVMPDTGLEPLGAAVLTLPYSPDLYHAGGLIVVPATYSKHLQIIENRVVIVAIGPEAWAEEENPRAHIGQKVFISKHCGFQAQSPKDGRLYRLVNADDIFCRIYDDVQLADIFKQAVTA